MLKQNGNSPSQSDDLFQLIHSLEKAEKRYFRLFSNISQSASRQSTVELFDLMVSMNTWNEEHLKRRAANYPWHLQLAKVKNRLYEQILKSLRLLRDGKQPEAKLFSQLEDLEILYQKGQFNTVKKRLSRLKKSADPFNLPEINIQIQKWERRIELLQPPRTGIPKTKFRGEGSIEMLSYEAQLSQLHDFLRVLIRYKYGGKDYRNQQLTEVLEDPLLQELPASASIRARIHFNNSNGLARLALGQAKAALPYYETLVKIWEKQPKWIAVDPELYFSSFNNYFNCRLYAFDREAIQEVFALEVPSFFTAKQKLRFERMQKSAELISLNLFGGGPEVPERIQAIADWLLKAENHINLSHWLVMAYNLGNFHFLHDQFTEANLWFFKVLGKERRHIRQDIRVAAMLLQTLAQIQKENADIVENLLRNAKRKLKDLDLKFELVMLQYLKKYFLAKDKESQDQNLKDLVQEINDFQTRETLKMPPGFLEVRLWAESTLDGCTISEKVKELRGY